MKKSDRTEIIDPSTKRIARLFDPRLDKWPDHFALEGFRIVPLTEIGRAMIAAFDLNQPRRLRIREAERMFGLF